MVGDPVESRWSVPPPHREVEASIPADHPVGHVQGHSGHEFLLVCQIAGSPRLEMDGVDGPVGPVEGEDRIAVLPGKGRAPSRDHSGGRSGTDIESRWQHIGIPGGELAGAGPPAELAAAGAVVDPGGPVPGRPAVPLHVRIVGEHLAVAVEGDVVLVAEADGVEVPALPLGIGTGDPASRRPDVAGMAPGIGHAGQKLVLPVDQRDGGGLGIGRAGVISPQDQQGLPVGREHHRMGTVLSRSLELPQSLHPIEPVVAIRIGQTVEARAVPADAPSVDHHIETVMGPEQSVGRGDFRRNPLHRLGTSSPEGQPEDPLLPLIGAVEAPPVIDGHGHPGSLARSQHLVDALDGESLRVHLRCTPFLAHEQDLRGGKKDEER